MKTNKAKKIIPTDAIKGKIDTEPIFKKPEEGEVERILNDKRQNMVQAIKDHFRLVFTYKRESLKLKRLMRQEEEGKVFLDNYQLPMDKEEVSLHLEEGEIEVKFMRSSVKASFDDLEKTWGLNEEKLERKFNAWFIKNKNIE